MVTAIDLEHHLKREREERKLAFVAADPAARTSHSTLADGHAERAAQVRIQLSLHGNEVSVMASGAR